MVDIVIVNWNSGLYLKKCIESLFKDGGDMLINKIFIIDNCSADGSVNNILSDKKIEITSNTENLGFAKACNQGFMLARSPYVLLLNPDTQVYKNTIPDCLSFMQSNKEIDILGCKLLNEKGAVTKSCARFPSAATIFNDASGLSKIAPSLFTPATLMTDWDHLESRYVKQVMGAFMFMRREVFEKVGYFDERFFVYYEELDFSYRLDRLGGKTYFNSSIAAMHTGEGTTSAVKAFRLFLNLSSRLLYSKKHFSVAGYALVFICTYSLEFLSRTFFLLFSGRVKEIKDLAVAYKLMVTRKPGNQ